MAQQYVLGIDSSTQSCKALLVDAVSGEVVEVRRAGHPDGTQVDPKHWLAAMEEATDGLLERAAAVSVGGQQHGMVALDETGEVVRPAMLWNDTSSATQARELVEELGGAQAAAELTGSVPVASFTVTKLRWLRDNEPQNAARAHRVLLPHDHLTWHLGGRQEATTDHGDASGTGYYSTSRREWVPELAERALGHALEVPRLAGPWEQVGTTATGAAVGPGTGDNMAAALGLDMQPGDVCLSLGTSGVASAVVEQSVHDGTGLVAGFADATGRYLPLACTLNGSRVLELGRRLLGVDFAEFDRLALAGAPCAHGTVLLPYLDGERTPDRPHASGVLQGLTAATTREDLARAYVEGLLCSMADAVQALVAATGAEPRRVLLIGGASQSEAVRRLAPAVLGRPVHVPPAGEYVALGAARQAARVLGGPEADAGWPAVTGETYEADATPEVMERYSALRDATDGWGEEHAAG